MSEPAPVEGAAVAFVEAAEGAAELDWLMLWTELGGGFMGAGEGPRDGQGARAALCAAGCEGEGPYIVRGGGSALVLELWVVARREGATVRAPAAIVVSDPACAGGELERSVIAELDYAVAPGGVELYMAVDVVAPREGAAVVGCASRRVECQTWIEDAELIAGGGGQPDWACRFD